MRQLFKYILLLSLFVASPALAAQGDQVVLKESRIKEVISDYLLQRTENLDMEVKVKNIGFRGDLTVPRGTTSFDVVAPDQWPGWGRVNLALIVRVDDSVVRNLSVPVEVEALTAMVVAVRPLERGEIIGESDVALQKRDIAASPGKICRSLEDVVGKRVKMVVRGNMPVRSDYLEKVPLIKSGQGVTILLENEIMKVTAIGKARSAGAEGDLITVRNLNSNKDIPARVIDANTVKVDF